MAINHDNTTYKKIENLISESSLHEVFNLLRPNKELLSDPVLSELLRKQEETYKYMIHFLVEGYPDTGRDRMLDTIKSNLLFINDTIDRNSIIKDSPDVYSSTLRFERLRKSTLNSRLTDYKNAESVAMLADEAGSDLALRRNADEALLSIFSYVWTMFGAPSGEYSEIVESVNDNALPFRFKAQMISALMLGNLTFFDRKAFTALLDIYDSAVDSKISARALVAITMLIASHPERIKLDPEIKDRLSLWQDSIIIYRQLREIVLNLIKAHDTQRISSKMQNEVLPELMKLRPEILGKLKNISEASDIEMLGENPEWEDLINKNGLGDKLKELTEMQMEGGDVMMMAFSNLKSFPFFNNVSNWFLPFFSNHSELHNGLTGNNIKLTELLDMEGVMCDSDKYSFALSLNRMPESQRDMLSERMSEQMEQFKEIMADRKLKSSVPEFDLEVTRYVRDIYRFFKLYRKKDDFADPFAKPLDIKSLPVVCDVLDDADIMQVVSEFYFKRGYYSEAIPMLKALAEGDSQDSLLWEKIGYSYNSLGNLEEAMNWYKKAELLHPDSKWLIKKIALCNRMLGNFEEASVYYKKALDSDTDNYHLLMSAGHCLLESGDVADALLEYYHADYVNPDKASTWRALAWAELNNGNADKSIAYYHKLLESSDCNAVDHLNAGHAYYISRNLKKAVECYKRSALQSGFGIEGLEKSLHDDSQTIINLGGKSEELNLLLEKVKYEIY